MLKHQFPNLFFYPPVDTTSGPGADTKIPSTKTADDINDLFKDLDTETPPEKKEVKEVKTKTKEEDEPELEPDDELELLEPDEEVEKLDLKEEDNLDIETPPRKKEILREYPEIFKKFPFLEKMMYRDREYTQLFGSFDDAKEIAERSETFNEFENQLLSGNTVEILKNVKDVDEKAFNMIVDDYLPSLAKVDKEAYYHVIGNLNKKLIMEMVAEANETENEDLKRAALLVNQFIFGTAKFTAPTNRVPKDSKDSKEKNEIEQERLALVRERFEETRDNLQSKVDNTLRATISQYIDPKGKMSSYEKKNAIADAMKYLGQAIASDSSVVKNLDRLWRDAFDKKFSKDTQDRIQSYYLSKAKSNLKNAILKARAEALKDSRPEGRTKEVDDREEEETNSRRPARIITPGRPSQPKGKNEMRKGESVTDYFMRD